MSTLRQTSLALLALAMFIGGLRTAVGAVAQTGVPAAQQQFEREIRPLFAKNCVRCHGAQLKLQGLDLSSLDGILKGSESGPVLAPGDAKASRLYKLVVERRMPMDQPKALTDAEIESVGRWIEGSAALAKRGQTAAASETDVVALMWMHCTPCHGTRLREGGLDLRTRASLLKGGRSGPAVAPGQPERSLLIQKIRAGQMPPPERYQEANVVPVAKPDLERLAAWISKGAPNDGVEPDAAGREPDPLVSDEDRAFWAFQPPKRVEPPTVRGVGRVGNPIDAFVLAKLEEKGLTLSPEAARPTLLRRAYLDLTGMLPAPEEVKAFVSDPDPEAYERLVERLLASPHYGERWGRYWLDLAGYRDHPQAWRYRDYVIRSLNADKPYDRFLLEQLAGDELADYENAPVLTQELMDNLIATGFLRLADDHTSSPQTNFLPDRMEVLADEVQIFSSAVLGLTVGCARCHSHKFDPLPQRDYYRLVAVFKGAFDPYDWLPPPSEGLMPNKMLNVGYRMLPYVDPGTNPLKQAELERARKAHNEKADRQVAVLREELEKKAKPLREKLLEKRLAAMSAELHQDLRKMLATPVKERSVPQKYLAEKFGKALEIDPEELQKLDPDYQRAAEESARRVATVEATELPDPQVRALWDRGEPSPTFILQRGEPYSPGRLVGPGVPAVLMASNTPFDVKPPWPGAPKSGRRLALARWLVGPDHPLTARVMVNRIWKHHFGEGIVKTLADFGRMGTRPSHPELLDWLATEFTRQSWSLKAMHRLMMTSSTYRQSSKVTPQNKKLDPGNALWSRMPLQRMDAEALYDSLLVVSKRLDDKLFGPPDPVSTRKDGLATPVETEKGWRRGIYLRQAQRYGRGIPSLLETFDFPQMAPNCVERVESTVAPQALHLLNDGMVRRLAASLAERVWAEAGANPGQQIERAYLISLSRPPAAEERTLSREKLRQFTTAWTPKSGTEAAQKALETFCHALINSGAFLYVD